MVKFFKEPPLNSNSKSAQLKRNLALRVYRDINNNNTDVVGIANESYTYIKNIYELEDFDAYYDLSSSGRCNRFLKAGTQIASMVFPVGNEIVRIMLTNEALSLIVSSPYIKVPLSILFSIPSFSLNTLATIRTSGNIYDFAYEKITRSSLPSYMKYFYLKASVGICVASFILSFLSTGGDAFVAYDTAKTSIFPALKDVLPFFVIVNNTIFVTYALINVAQDTSINAIGRFGTLRMKIAARITKAYEYAASIIDTLTPKSLTLDEVDN